MKITLLLHFNLSLRHELRMFILHFHDKSFQNYTWAGSIIVYRWF